MVENPQYHSLEEFQNRSRKLQELRDLGIDPYPHNYNPDYTAEDLHEKFNNATIGDSSAAEQGNTQEVRVAGRLVLFRSMGKNAFAHLQDHSGRIQIMCNRDNTKFEGYEGEEPKPIKLIEKKLDLGDIIGVEGHLFHTHKGELTIFAKKVKLLSKTLLPLAEKHTGLADKELRYRKRWLDLISNEDVRKKFQMRSQILQSIRQYCNEKGFLEVETPVLQSIYGGAEARPFMTTLNALNQDMYMRIALEIPLKKLIVGGMDKVFEIGKVFRNEGIDRNHNPEFTLMEAYASYWDYNDMMHFTEKLFEKIAIELHGATKFPIHTHEDEPPVEVDFASPWKRMSMIESLLHYANIDVDKLTEEEMRKILLESGHIDPEKLKMLSRGLMIAALFEVEVEPKLVQPHHITDHPIETAILCKLHRKPEEKEKGLIERFESFVLGQEICNAYSELNDPELQRKLFVEQAKRRDAGDEEASPIDEDFIESICQGMPPTGGVGIGIDRLVMLMTDSHSIRDVLFFPWMKPLE